MVFNTCFFLRLVKPSPAVLFSFFHFISDGLRYKTFCICLMTSLMFCKCVCFHFYFLACLHIQGIYRRSSRQYIVTFILTNVCDGKISETIYLQWIGKSFHSLFWRVCVWRLQMRKKSRENNFWNWKYRHTRSCEMKSFLYLSVFSSFLACGNIN